MPLPSPVTAPSTGFLPFAWRSLQLVAALPEAFWIALLRLGPPWRWRRDRALRALGAGLRRLCERLGATFIKLGQIASTRGDLLPRPLVAELALLRDRVPAFDFQTVRALVEAEFGRPLESLFDDFEPAPVAAASVAQVHRARLKPSGETVAVKVRRPDIADKVALDRAILGSLARNLERFIPTFRLISLEEAFARFGEAVADQLDFELEAANNRRFQRDFADDPDIVFPTLHPEACSSGVLTMDFVDGVEEHEVEASDIDVLRVVEAGMRAVCRMVFCNGFVHADLHPGNLRFLPPGRVVFLDLGLVGEIDDENRITTARLVFSLATGDGATVARIFYESAPHRATPDYAAYEAEMISFVASVQDKGLSHLQVTLEIGRIFDILRRHRVQARAHMTMVNLALMTAEGLGKRLAPDLSLADEALPYLAEALGAVLPSDPPRGS